MRKIFIGIISLFLLKSWGEIKLNPFVPLLPKKIEKTEVVDKLLNIEEIKLEGIILGKEKACVIINGEVYKKGDVLKECGAQIIKIDKEGIDLKYNKKIYRIKMEIKTEKEMR